MQPPHHALLYFLFGNQAELILPNLPERLQRWDEAFDQWLLAASQTSPRLATYHFSAWRSLLKFFPRPPWEAQPADLQGWIDHLINDLAYTPGTAARMLTSLRAFYRFVQAQQIESPPPTNPAEGLSGPYEGSAPPAYSLSERELAAFLAAIDHHASPLGKRNLAMVLLIIHCGLSPREVRLIRWQDLAVDWHASTANLHRLNIHASCQVDLPPLVVDALHDFLLNAGRLESIQPGEILFPAINESFPKHRPLTAENWRITRPMPPVAFEHVIRSVAARAGLRPDRVTPSVIRNTALAIHIQTGDDLPALQRFLGFRNRDKVYELRKRVVIQPQDVLWRSDAGPHPGLYAGALPPADLALLARAQPAGLQDEIDALRLTLMRTLRQTQDASPNEQIRLLDSYSAAANRLANLLKVQKELNETGDTFDARLDQALRQAQKEMGWELGMSNDE
jgi:integrase